MSKAPFRESGDNSFQTIIPGTHQRVAYTGASSQSAALNANTSVVELFSTTDCWIKFGTNPVAVANDGTSIPLRAGLRVTYGVPTKSDKIAVIRDVDSGNLDIVEGA